MIVTKSTFERWVKYLKQKQRFSFDTETTGLEAYKGSRMFSLACATDEVSLYFNFNFYHDIEEQNLLDHRHKKGLQDLFGDERLFLFAHNAKFDMHILYQDNIEVKGTVHCTYAIERLIRNDVLDRSLDELAKHYLKETKDDAVKKWLDDNGHFTVRMKGKQKIKDYQFIKAPFSLIQPYAEKDARLTYNIGEKQIAHIENVSTKLATDKKLSRVYENELKLTTTLFHMERRGIAIDKEYCEKALATEKTRYASAMSEFKDLTGFEFVDSRKTLVPAFKKLNMSYGLTEKGNPSFTDEVLAKLDNPLVKVIQDYRDAYKRAHSYFENFVSLCDKNGIIHTDFNQGGTKTGRMSATKPALQTLTKEEDEAALFSVRGSFRPRNSDYILFKPDYDQMEYRFMMEYAKEMKVIEQVRAGLDVHEATAKMIGDSRQNAKTVNFLLLYGGGLDVFSKKLKCSIAEAERKKIAYFENLPNVKRFVRNVKMTAEERGYLINWLGRIYNFSNSKLSFKGPNYIIQGGTADVVKIAMNRCFDLLKGTLSYLILQVHDELVFEIHKSELHLCAKIVEIMQTSFPFKLLQLTASPEYCPVNMGAKVAGYPA